MKQAKGHIAMIGANVIWGLMAPVVKTVMLAGVVTPLMIADFRIVGAAVLFWCLSLFLPREKVCAKDLALLAGASLCGIVCNQGCYVFGVGLTSPGEAAVMTTTMPLWVMLLAALVLKEPITWKKAGGIFFGACGALILVFTGKSAISSSGDNPTLGDTLVLIAQCSYALYLTLYKNFITKYSVVTLMKWMFTFAAIIVTAVSAPHLLSVDWGAISGSDWAGVAYTVFFATFIAYICIMVGQKLLRPTLVGMYNYVQPIVASLVGVYLGMEIFTPLKLLAVIFIFFGVYLVTISRAAAPKQKTLTVD